MATGAINMPNDLTFKSFSVPTDVATRGYCEAGGYNTVGCHITLMVKYHAVASYSNSPSIFSISKLPRCDTALTCIDITNGIASSIESSVPCGIGTDGRVFVKQITTDHIYAISGSFVADN